MYGEEAEGFDTKHAVFVSYSHTFLYRFLNLQAISPWKANQTPVPGHSLHKSANLMHRAHSAALWYTFLQPSFFLSVIFFFSQSFSSLRQEFLKWAVVWKRFVVSGSSSWWKFAELEPWNVAAVSEELGHSSWVSLLGRWSNEGKALIDFLPPSLDYSLSWYPFYAQSHFII